MDHNFCDLFRVVKSSRLLAKIATYLVSIGRLLCLAFLYRNFFFIPGLAAYFDNSAIYLKTFWQPCLFTGFTFRSYCFWFYMKPEIKLHKLYTISGQLLPLFSEKEVYQRMVWHVLHCFTKSPVANLWLILLRVFWKLENTIIFVFTFTNLL